jgi:ABC-2 type transport system ATP-binding protein
MVAGFDVCREPEEVRKRIGLSGQYAAVDEHLTGFENLDMIGRLYRLGRRRARTRARDLLEQFGLAEAGDRPVKTYSGGMRRRLDLAGALVADVPILFLDEPTTGLDPRSRVDLWQTIRELVAGGTTLLLTTQYLEEADQLATDIVVIDHGHSIAHGAPDELKAAVGGERIEVIVCEGEDVTRAANVLAGFADGEMRVDEDRLAVIVPISGGVPVLTRALRELEVAGVALRDVGLRRPTLNEAFLTLTGHAAEEVDEGDARPEGSDHAEEVA